MPDTSTRAELWGRYFAAREAGDADGKRAAITALAENSQQVNDRMMPQRIMESDLGESATQLRSNLLP